MQEKETFFPTEALPEKEFYEFALKHIKKDGTFMSLGEILQSAALRNPDWIALLYKDQKVTYKQLYGWAVRLSNLLKKKGIKPGDRVLLWFENSIEFFVAINAIVQIGAVAAPLNIFLKQNEIKTIIQDAQPSLLIVSKKLAEKLYDNDIGITLPPILTEDDFDLSEVKDLPDFEVTSTDPEKMALLLYTSGTTGVPKGVMLSSKNMLSNIAQGIARLGLTHKERIFGALPLFHSFSQLTCVWGALFVNCCVIIIPKIDRRSLLEGLKKKPTLFLGVPALYGLMCLLKTADFQKVKHFVSGGDALPDKIRAGFGLLYGRKICNGYGLTETSPLIAVNFDDELYPTNTVGRPVLGMQVQIRDEKGRVLSHGEIGQLWVKGDNVMLGYYKAPEATRAILQDGWLDTGDLAYIDQKERIVIAGRIKDLIINKGLNIYPQEIENIILTHSNVIFCGVIGVEEDASGEIPIAFVQLRVPQEDIEQQLRSLCKKNLAAYKIPRKFICSTKELPKTATSKVNKKALRAQYAK